MAELFETFPNLKRDGIIIKKMVESDLEALKEITENDNVYRYIPPFLYKKSKGNLLAAIRNIGGRDFDKKKFIKAGIYLEEEPNKLVGLAQMFDYKKRANKMTIGYTLNEKYWNKKIATRVISMMAEYLTVEMGVDKLFAYVMPENKYSAKALLKNNFIKEDYTEEGQNWGGRDIVTLNVFTYQKQDS